MDNDLKKKVFDEIVSQYKGFFWHNRGQQRALAKELGLNPASGKNTAFLKVICRTSNCVSRPCRFGKSCNKQEATWQFIERLTVESVMIRSFES